MSTASQLSSTFYIGWDVGSWNCDRNSKSRDGIAILDSSLALVGTVWRGNLRDGINQAASANDWLRALFELCKATIDASAARVVLAIDAPLGYSLQFTKLIADQRPVDSVAGYSTNQYLFRQTERTLFERGFNPLSAVVHMIGGQATKGMHVLAKFARVTEGCGVWSDGQTLTAIEAYPSACRHSPTLLGLRNGKQYPAQGNADKDDALTCALIAYMFDQHYQEMAPPPADVPVVEGWIWLPRDARPRPADAAA